MKTFLNQMYLANIGWHTEQMPFVRILIFYFEHKKEPVLTFSSNIDTVFAHAVQEDNRKIDVDLEEYGLLGVKGSNLWLLGDPEGKHKV